MYTNFIQLPYEDTLLLRDAFKLGKSGQMQVSDNKIVNYGYAVVDIEPLTLEALQEFCKSESNDELALLKETVLRLREPEKFVQKVKTADITK